MILEMLEQDTIKNHDSKDYGDQISDNCLFRNGQDKKYCGT